MKMLELLKEHPKTAIVIKQWFLDKMLESLKDESLPEDFKEYVRQQGIDDEKISNMVETSPRSLFDVFDDHKVFIQINVYSSSSSFSYLINEGDVVSGGWTNRKEAELAAIIQAFKLLEEKL
jgi:hypothetical protein